MLFVYLILGQVIALYVLVKFVYPKWYNKTIMKRRDEQRLKVVKFFNIR